MDDPESRIIVYDRLTKKLAKISLPTPIIFMDDFVETKSRTYLRNKYVVFNAITSTATAMALTKEGNLLVLEETGGMVFFIVLPFGGTTAGNSYEYRPYIAQ